MSKKTNPLLDATEKALLRLLKRTEMSVPGDGIEPPAGSRPPHTIDDQLDVVLAATKFLIVKNKIKPDESDDDGSFLRTAQRTLSGQPGESPSPRRRRDKRGAAEGSKPDAEGAGTAPAGANGSGANVSPPTYDVRKDLDLDA